MKTSSMMTTAIPRAPVGKAWEEVSASFDRFCLAAGIETLGTMMEADAEVACGPRHSRSEDRRGHRWGRTQGKIGFHAGKVVIERPRVRGLNGKELPLESWEQAVDEDYDSRVVIGPSGYGSTEFNSGAVMDVLAPALKAYAAANSGREPNDPSQLAPYLTTPAQQAALQKVAEHLARKNAP